MFVSAVREAIGNTPISRWVWVLLAFAIGYALLLVTQAMTLDVPNASSIVFSTARALVAAALMYVAPRSRPIQLAAVGFAAPLVVNTVRLALAGDRLLWPGTPSNSYLAFAQGVREATAAISQVGYLFELLAVLALAAYIGRIGTRGGWLIVGVSAGLAAAQAFSIATTSPSAEVYPTHLLVLSMLGAVTLVAWGYLLAVTVERRHALLSIAGAITLMNAALSLLTVTMLENAGPNDPVASIYMATLLVLGVVYWLTLIGGVLLELPRRADAEKDADRALNVRPAGSPSR
jgi:hypothetical protein